jgi:hypothetical protein
VRWIWLVAALACTRSAEPPPPSDHPPMAAAEKERAATICQKYVDRVCGCAASDPSLRDACDMAHAQPDAVRMHLDVLGGAPLAEVSPGGEVKGGATAGKPRPPLNENERRLTEASLRKVVAACVKLDAELDPTKCPRR